MTDANISARSPSPAKSAAAPRRGHSSPELLTLPANIGRLTLAQGGVLQSPLLAARKFAKFCSDRGRYITQARLARLERLGVFSPIFRVSTPPVETPALALPLTDERWFDEGWAIDTSAPDAVYEVPKDGDRESEAYYSVFQIDHLECVLSGMTLHVQLDGFVGLDADPAVVESKWRATWVAEAEVEAERLRAHQYRRAKALLCQFISDRYFPKTRTDKRTFKVREGGGYFDQWISVSGRDFDWANYSRKWDPHVVEKIFDLTPEKLNHAYSGLASAQAFCDPMSSWYQLTQFVSVEERDRLRGDALRAQTLRAGAEMLWFLYEDLYGEKLAPPNEVSAMITRHIPELEIRKDTRRYMELVVNRYGLNPQPKLSLIVEGPTEERVLTRLFDHWCGAPPGAYGIEFIVLGGVDAATGTKEDRFRAILRLIDYLHHHQTLTYLILDNERYARKLKAEVERARSIHHNERFVTRPDHIKIWRQAFEFDNFSATELAAALNMTSAPKTRFRVADVVALKKEANPGAALKRLYRERTGRALDKLALADTLFDIMISPGARRKIENRPIIKTLDKVARLAARNPLPILHEIWERNQKSSYLGRRAPVSQR